MLSEKMLQLAFLPTYPVRVPAGVAQGAGPTRPPTACCHIRPQRGLTLRTARGRAAPLGRDEVFVGSRLVSSTHASRGNWSMRSEIPSSGEVVDLGCAAERAFATCFAPVVTAFFVSTGALGAPVAIGSAISRFAFAATATLGCLGAFVAGFGTGLGVGVVSFTTRPRTMWLQPSPRSICSAEGLARLAFVAAG